MREVHLINPFENAFGGSELRTLSLASILEGVADVKLWSLGQPDSRLRSSRAIVPVDLAKARFPRSGTFVFVGAYYPIPMWVSVARPERAVLVYNVPYAPHLRGNLQLLETYEVPRIDVVVAAESLATHSRELGYEPTFEPSWIDFKRFAPIQSCPERPFTVGRHSRDVLEKFHEDDPALFLRLAEAGVRVRLMGATCIAGSMANHPNITILPSGAMPPEKFLGGLDAFLYRTHDVWNEAWGRAVVEAVAMGIPTILDKRVGALEMLEGGDGALVFKDSEEAFAHVIRLRDDSDFARRLAEKAMAKLRRFYSSEVRRAIADFYIKN